VKIHLNSLGCRLNEAELEQWAGDFSRAGDQVTDGVDDADIIVMNTCAVTKEAVRKSRQRTQRLQRANPSAKLVISGCYSTLETSSALAELGVDFSTKPSSRFYKNSRRLPLPMHLLHSYRCAWRRTQSID